MNDLKKCISLEKGKNILQCLKKLMPHSFIRLIVPTVLEATFRLKFTRIIPYMSVCMKH